MVQSDPRGEWTHLCSLAIDPADLTFADAEYIERINLVNISRVPFDSLDQSRTWPDLGIRAPIFFQLTDEFHVPDCYGEVVQIRIPETKLVRTSFFVPILIQS